MKHLQVLEASGLVRREKRGREVLYTLEAIAPDPNFQIEPLAGAKTGEPAVIVKSAGGARISILFSDVIHNTPKASLNLFLMGHRRRVAGRDSGKGPTAQTSIPKQLRLEDNGGRWRLGVSKRRSVDSKLTAKPPFRVETRARFA